MAGSAVGGALIAALILPLSLPIFVGALAEAREASARTLGDMLMAVAVMTDSRGLQLDDAVQSHVAMCTRCRTPESPRSRWVQEAGR